MTTTDAVWLATTLLNEHEDALTDWERDFLPSVQKRATAGIPLTALQADRLRDVARKHGVSLTEGITCDEEDLWA